MEKKICKKCGRELPLSKFKNNHLSKDGHADTCNCCVVRKRKMTMSKAIEAIVTPPSQKVILC